MRLDLTIPDPPLSATRRRTVVWKARVRRRALDRFVSPGSDADRGMEHQGNARGWCLLARLLCWATRNNRNR